MLTAKQLDEKFNYHFTVEQIKEMDKQKQVELEHEKWRKMQDSMMRMRRTSSSNEILLRAAKLKDTQVVREQKRELVIFSNGEKTQTEKDDVETIVSTVCHCAQLTLNDLQDRSREQEKVIPRALITLFIRWNTTVGTKAIGDILGKRDHSTIIFATQRACDGLDMQEPDITALFDKVNLRIDGRLRINFTEDKPYYEQFQDVLESRIGKR